MIRKLLIAYQASIALSDTLTGVLLIAAPAFTLALLGVHAPAEALPFVSWVGAFVFAVGLSCLYGLLLLFRPRAAARLETVWLLTAFCRASVAIFLALRIATGALEPGWLIVAAFDGACVVIQAVGLRKGWICNAAR